MGRRPQLTVIGSSGVIPRELEEVAERVGEAIARRGAILICGGRDGVMLAAARGAKRAGGITVGILPGVRHEEANPFIDIIIPTGLLFARNAVNVLAGDAVIAVGGGPGTLSEIALALSYGRPVVVVKGTGGAADLMAGREIGGCRVHAASDPEEAVELALRLAGFSR